MKPLCLWAVTLLVLSAPVAVFAEPVVDRMMTHEAAAALLGATVGPGIITVQTPALQDFRFAGTQPQDFVEVALINSQEQGIAPADYYRDNTREGPGHTVEAIAGLGESASYVQGANNSSITVLYHERILVIGVGHSRNAGLKAALIQAAREALPKI